MMALFDVSPVDEEGHYDFPEIQLKLLERIDKEKYGSLNARMQMNLSEF